MSDLRGVWLVPLFAVTAGSARPCSARKYELLKRNNSRKAFALGLIQYPFYSSWFFLLLGAELFSFEMRVCSCRDPASGSPVLQLLCRVFPSQAAWKWRPDPPWGFWMTTDFFRFVRRSLISGAGGRRGGVRREKAFLAATFT